MKRSMIHEALITLIEARCTLSKKENWTQGWYAIDANNKETHSSAPTACKYCPLGALFRSAISRSSAHRQTLWPGFIGEFSVSDVVLKAVTFCVPHLPPAFKSDDPFVFTGPMQRIVKFNDGTLHKDVIALLDNGIVSAKEAFDIEVSNTK